MSNTPKKIVLSAYATPYTIGQCERCQRQSYWYYHAVTPENDAYTVLTSFPICARCVPQLLPHGYFTPASITTTLLQSVNKTFTFGESDGRPFMAVLDATTLPDIVRQLESKV